MKDKYPKNYLLLMAVSVFCLIAIVFTSSYAYFKARIVNNTNPFELIGGTIKLQLSENSISGEKLLPILDSQKDTNSQIKNFTVKRTDESNVDVCYNVYLIIESISDNIKNSKYMKYELTNGSSTTTGNFSTVAYQDGKAIILLAQNKYLSETNTTGDAYSLKIWLSYDGSVDQTSLLGGNFSAHIYAQGNSGKTCPGSVETKPTLYEKILSDNLTRSTRDTYDAVFTNNTTGTLFIATEKNVHNTTDTTVYYYAGNTTNNWVKFGGYYWRIIRTNADGSIRLLYAGTEAEGTSGQNGYISTSAFNPSSDSSKYVGYMYGENDDTLANARTNTNDSTIKTIIDNWYANNIISYTKYLSTTAVYCNDRNYTVEENYTYFGARTRVYTNYAPTYDCTEAADAFSGSNTSAKLTYPIALMTADEIMRAGGKGGTNLTSPYAWYYLNSANESITGVHIWWLMSPSNWAGGYARVFVMGGSYDPDYLRGSDYPGCLSYTGAGISVIDVRPVISLKSDVLWSSGDGTAESPYEIVMN